MCVGWTTRRLSRTGESYRRISKYVWLSGCDVVIWLGDFANISEFVWVWALKMNDGWVDKRIYELELAKENNEKTENVENVEEEFACLIEQEEKQEQKMASVEKCIPEEERKVTMKEGDENVDRLGTQKGEAGEDKTQTEEGVSEESKIKDDNMKTKLAKEDKVAESESGRSEPPPAPETIENQESTTPILELVEAPGKRKMTKLKKMKQVKEEKAVLKQQRLAEEEVRRKEINKQFGHLFFEREAEEGEENDVRPLKKGVKGKIEEEEGEDQDQDLEELIDRSFDGDKGEYDQETADRKFIEDMAKDSEKIMDFVRRQEERAKDLASGQELLKKDRRDRLDVIKQLMQQIKGDNGRQNTVRNIDGIGVRRHIDIEDEHSLIDKGC